MSEEANIPMRTLGRTGLRVSVLGVGGFHIGKDRDLDLGRRIIRTAIDEGVNFLDNAWCYNQGVSEWIMGHALRDGYRGRVVLMTKNHGRDGTTYRAQLEDSLRRLQTDCIDIVQFHEVIDDDTPARLYSGGALEEALKARGEGKIRFIGFTGHRKPELLKEMLDGDFDWDTVQLPVNLLDYHYRSFLHQIVPILQKRKIGIIGMKSLAGDGTSMFETGVSAAEAIRFALAMPVDTLVSGMDSPELVMENVGIARSFSGLTDAEREALLERVAPYASEGRLEKYKTA